MMREKVIVADEEVGRTSLTKNFRRPRGNSRNRVNIWKTSILTLGILLLLYLTEIIEIRKPYGAGPDNVVANVELKHPSVSTINFSLNESKNGNLDNPIDSIQKETNPHDNEKDVAKNAENISLNERQKDKVESVNKSTSLPKNPEKTASITNEMKNRHMYKRRGQPMSEEDKNAMIEKWGSWTLVDNKERPTEDYYAAYPNRDIPRSEFPANAWQIDDEYLKEFLPEAIQLIERTQEAILAEYGHTEGSWEERTEMFELEIFDSLEKASDNIIQKPEWRKDREGERGGWSTSKSMEGLKRRLLHAIMTGTSIIFICSRCNQKPEKPISQNRNPFKFVSLHFFHRGYFHRSSGGAFVCCRSREQFYPELHRSSSVDLRGCFRPFGCKACQQKFCKWWIRNTPAWTCSEFCLWPIY